MVFANVSCKDQSSTSSSEIWPCMLRKLEMGSECLGVSPCQRSACGARESWRRARALPRAAVVVVTFCNFSALMQRSGSVLYLQTAAVETEEQNHSDGLKFELLSAIFNFTSISLNRASSGLIWDKKNLFFSCKKTCISSSYHLYPDRNRFLQLSLD